MSERREAALQRRIAELQQDSHDEVNEQGEKGKEILSSTLQQKLQKAEVDLKERYEWV